MTIDIFKGHPEGLKVLFFTELWERFSYYGMRAILILYMIAACKDGGLNFSVAKASLIYGVYTSLVYTTSIPGGFIADYFLGSKLSIVIGGSIIALGHILLTVNSLPFFFAGLLFIVLGTGLLKPSVSALVGSLYTENESNRDSGFIIYYMGINIGAALAPIVCGFLAQSSEFKEFLAKNHFNSELSWHFGFGAAAIGMILGLITFLHNKKFLDKDAMPKSLPSEKLEFTPLTKIETNRLIIIGVLFFFSALFWSIYEQGGASLNIFANYYTDCHVFNHKFPPSYLQTFQAVFIIIFAPMVANFWSLLGSRQPSSQAKFMLGLILIGVGIGIMSIASYSALNHKISPLWLIACYLFEVLGELCLSPVGLSTVTKLAPLRYVGLVLGIWYLSNALGNFLAGLWSSFCDLSDPVKCGYIFMYMAISAFLSAFCLYLLLPKLKRLGDEN